MACLASAHGIARIAITGISFRTLHDIDFVGYTNEDTKNKVYLVEINAFNLLVIKKKLEAELSKELSKMYKEMFATSTEDEAVVKLRKKLRNYQLQGVNFLHIKKGKALLADDMGLGKTAQIIGTASAVPEQYLPMVVLCPAHIKLNWQDEFEQWYPRAKVEVLFGRSPCKISPTTNVVILNQHILEAWKDSVLALSPKWLIIDEAHSFVSANTKTYAIVEQFAHQIGKTTLVTGTPLVNMVKDLWGLLNLINPYILGGYTRFQNRFCPEAAYNHEKVSFYRSGGWKRWGKPIKTLKPASASKEDLELLYRILIHTCMIRRLKKDVASDLPKISRKVIRIQVDSVEFWKAEKELREKVKKELAARGEKDAVIDMKAYSRLRRLVGEAKKECVVEWIKVWLDSTTPDRKLIVTGWHKDLLEKLHTIFPDSFLITGDVDTVEKHNRSKAFNKEGGKRLLFGNTKAIGTGINLVSADTILNIELPYTGADLEQVEARIHRLSQKANKVFYVYLVVKGTLEEDLLKYISKKQRLASSVLDNQKKVVLEDC